MKHCVINEKIADNKIKGGLKEPLTLITTTKIYKNYVNCLNVFWHKCYFYCILNRIYYFKNIKFYGIHPAPVTSSITVTKNYRLGSDLKNMITLIFNLKKNLNNHIY